MPVISMRRLLEAGIHFGHQTRRWNPKMSEFIYGERNGIYIIDLQKTVLKIKEACEFIKEIVTKDEYVLFVGTKKQAQIAVEEEAKRCGMFYVNQRWLGGMLTNFVTIRKNVKRLNDLEKMEKLVFSKLSREEATKLTKEKNKLEVLLGGVRNMTKLPAVLFVVDSKKEHTAVLEARRLEIPIIGVADTNSDPDEIDYIIPANDDAMKSIKLLSSIIADTIIESRPIKAEDKKEETETEESTKVTYEEEKDFEDILLEEFGEADVKAMKKMKKKVKELPIESK